MALSISSICNKLPPSQRQLDSSYPKSPVRSFIQKGLAETGISLKHQSHPPLTPFVLSWSQTLLPSLMIFTCCHILVFLVFFQSLSALFMYLLILPESYRHAKFDCSLNFRNDFCKRCYGVSSSAQVKLQRHLKHIANYKTAYKCHINVFWSTLHITFLVGYIKSSHRFLFSHTGKFTCCSLYSNEIPSDKQIKTPKFRQNVSLPWR